MADVTVGKSNAFDRFCEDVRLPENRLVPEVNDLLLEKSRLLVDKFVKALEDEDLMGCKLEQCECLIKQALETITVVGVEYNRLLTKTEGVEMAHLTLKRRLQKIQSLRTQFDNRMKVFIGMKNESYDASKKFEETTLDIFESVDCLNLDAEADWKLAIAAYQEQFDIVKQKARLAEIRYQLGLGPAPKTGDKRKDDAVTDDEIESWTYSDAYAKVSSRLAKNGKRFPCEWIGCASDFSRKDSMQEHFVNVHMNIYKSLPCSECKETFKSHRDLLVHKRQNHDVELLKCDQCDTEYISVAGLRNHKKHTHTNNRYICQKCEKSFKQTSNLNLHIQQEHSLTGNVFSRQLEAVLKGGDEAKAILKAGRKDVEFVESLFIGHDQKSGNYFLHETSVKRFEFTSDLIMQMNYMGKYALIPNQPEKRPKQHAHEFKNFIAKASDNPTKKLRLMQERVNDKGAEFTYTTFFNNKPTQFSAIVETSIIHAIGKSNLFNDNHGAKLPEKIPWHNDLERIARLGTYFIHKMISERQSWS